MSFLWNIFLVVGVALDSLSSFPLDVTNESSLCCVSLLLHCFHSRYENTLKRRIAKVNNCAFQMLNLALDTTLGTQSGADRNNLGFTAAIRGRQLLHINGDMMFVPYSARIS
jgi:hypothetical protein